MGAGNVVASAYSRLQEVSDVSAPVTDYFASGGGAPAAPPPGEPPGGPPNPAEMLNQIALDKELFEGFAPVLLKMGYAIEAEVQINDRFGFSRTVTLAKIGEDVKFYLIVIPKPILENSTLANFGAISPLQHFFDRNSQLYMISRDLLVIDDAFDVLMEDWTTYKGIKVFFISWTHVKKFLGEKNDTQKVFRMQRMLKLDQAPATKPEVKPVEATEISIDEEDRAVRLMKQQAISPAFPTAQDYFNNLTRRAHLPDEDRSELAWKGNAEIDARTLLDAAKRNSYPNDHARAGQKQIGWILKAVVDDLNPDDAKTLINIILNHGLLSNAKAVEELQQMLGESGGRAAGE